MSATGFDPDTLAALEEQREFLLRSLDDLDREWAAGDIDDGDYRALRDDYTARAAAVIRAIDEQRAEMPAPARRRPWRALVAVVAVAAMALASGWAVALGSGTRSTGASPTGDIRETSVAKLRRAAELVGQGEILEAIKTYDDVLADDPTNPQALTYKGWVLVTVGDESRRTELVDRGQELLEQAIDAHPDYPDAYFFYGYVLLNLHGDRERAIGAFQAALANDPPPPMAEQARAELERLSAED